MALYFYRQAVPVSRLKRRQFTFTHCTWYSFHQRWENERLSRPQNLLVVLNLGLVIKYANHQTIVPYIFETKFCSSVSIENVLCYLKSIFFKKLQDYSVVGQLLPHNNLDTSVSKLTRKMENYIRRTKIKRNRKIL